MHFRFSAPLLLILGSLFLTSGALSAPSWPEVVRLNAEGAPSTDFGEVVFEITKEEFLSDEEWQQRLESRLSELKIQIENVRLDASTDPEVLAKLEDDYDSILGQAKKITGGLVLWETHHSYRQIYNDDTDSTREDYFYLEADESFDSEETPDRVIIRKGDEDFQYDRTLNRAIRSKAPSRDRFRKTQDFLRSGKIPSYFTEGAKYIRSEQVDGVLAFVYEINPPDDPFVTYLWLAPSLNYQLVRGENWQKEPKALYFEVTNSDFNEVAGYMVPFCVTNINYPIVPNAPMPFMKMVIADVIDIDLTTPVGDDNFDIVRIRL